VADNSPDGAATPDEAERIGELVERVAHQADEPESVLGERLASVRRRLLSFGDAIGGSPERVVDLPFTRPDGMPEPLYVRQDMGMLTQVTGWLLQNQHIGLVSPTGTGKTAVREIVRRDLGDHEEFAVAVVENPRETTPRQVYATLLRAARSAGYEPDDRNYWQTRDGIPWAAEDARTAFTEVVGKLDADGRTLLLVVDEIEALPEAILSTLQTVANTGACLFLLGTPDGQERLAELRGTLDSRLYYHEGIGPFGLHDVAEYIARSLAYFRDRPHGRARQDLFTDRAVRDIHERTGGTPRDVRIACQDQFTRAAFLWDRTDQAADRIQITPELRHQQFELTE